MEESSIIMYSGYWRRRLHRLGRFVRKYHLLGWSSDMQVWKKHVEPRWGINYLDNVLRGVSQVFLVNNPLSGFCFLVALALNDLGFLVCASYASLLNTALATMLAKDREALNRGLFGFNGVLVAIAVFLFWGDKTDFRMFVLSPILVSLSLAVQLFLARAFAAAGGFPVLTLPFVLVTWCFLLSGGLPDSRWSLLGPLALLDNEEGSVIKSIPLLSARPHAKHFSPGELAASPLVGLSQVFFCSTYASTAVFALGLFLSSPWHLLAAFGGSILSTSLAFGHGVPLRELQSGLWGYDGALAGAALGGTFLALGPAELVPWAGGVALAVLVRLAASRVLALLGLPPLTVAFCLGTLVSVAAAGQLRGVETPDEAGARSKWGGSVGWLLHRVSLVLHEAVALDSEEEALELGEGDYRPETDDDNDDGGSGSEDDDDDIGGDDDDVLEDLDLMLREVGAGGDSPRGAAVAPTGRDPRPSASIAPIRELRRLKTPQHKPQGRLELLNRAASFFRSKSNEGMASARGGSSSDRRDYEMFDQSPRQKTPRSHLSGSDSGSDVSSGEDQIL